MRYCFILEHTVHVVYINFRLIKHKCIIYPQSYHKKRGFLLVLFKIDMSKVVWIQ